MSNPLYEDLERSTQSNDPRATLLRALEDLWHLVDLLAAQESVFDTKSALYSLFAHCLQLHQNIFHSHGINQYNLLIKNLLRYLEEFLRLSTDIPNIKNAGGERTPVTYPGLAGFHDLMVTAGQGKQQNIKLMKSRINLGNKEQLNALEEVLMLANKHLNDQNSPKTFTDFQSQRNPRQVPPDHILPAAESLFQVLNSKKKCTCNPSHRYVVQLCLETHLARIDDCNFDVYLGLESSWQEARIQSVLRRSCSESPTIIIGNTNGVSPPASLATAQKRELKRKVERLCADIMKIRKNLPDYGLRFRMEENCLWKLQSERSSFNIDPSKAPVTLAQFIAEKSNLLNEKTKRVLSVLLSYAIYHLIGTPWLKSWGSSNITFFRSSTGLPLRPYIETHLDENMIEDTERPSFDNEEDEFDPDDALRPPYPCLIDLAVVLLELHKAASLDCLASLYGEDDTVHGSDVVMARYILTREIFRHCASEMTDQTRMAVEACLNSTIGLDEEGNRLDESALRGVIYRRIVHPLEDELEQGFSDLAIHRLDMLVRNLDLDKGGQPLPLEKRVKPLEHYRPVPRSKRRNSDDTERPRVRVRFSHQLESRIQPVGHPLSGANKPNPSGAFSNTGVNEKEMSLLVPRAVSGRLPTKRPDTIRVLNVPDELSQEALKLQIDNVIGSPCKIHSLARASRAGPSWRKYATVTFPSLPNEKLVEVLGTIKKKSHGTLGLQYDKFFMGITPLYDAGEDAVVDIIALEGLGTNPFGTFRSPEGDEMWLRDWLPDAFPACRILLYGYDSRVPGSKSNQSVAEIAGTCKSFIMNFRELTKTTKRPIIWIGQSMGGLIVQEVLIQSHLHSSEDPGNLMAHTTGFLGYGVPTNGLRNESLLDLVREQPNFDLIQSICIEDNRPSRYLIDLSNRFALCSKSLCDRVYHFYETNPSPDIINADTLPIRRVHDPEVVGRENRYWIPANHSELVKIASTSDLTYIATVQALSIVYDSIGH